MSALGVLAPRPGPVGVVRSVGLAAAGYAAAYLRARVQVEAARRVACRDELTGLANRAGLAERGPRLLAAAGRRGVPAGVVLLDLVGFKQVNDTFGHPAGDAVLVEVAARLAALAGRCGVAVRMSGGGDEFAVLLPAPHPAGGLAGGPEVWLSEWLATAHRRLCVPVAVGAREVAVGATLGGALARPGEGLSALLARADAAMYTARARGEHTHVDSGAVAGVPRPRPGVRRRDTAPPPVGRVLVRRVVGGAW